MNRLVSISCLILFFSAIPVQAQIVRRPLVRRFIQSPFVHEAVNFGIHQFLPGFPSLPSLTKDSPTKDSPILVDASVKGNLDRTAKNLRDADEIMTALLDKNKALLNQKDAPKKDGKVDPIPEPKKVDPNAAKKAGKIDDTSKLFQSHMEKGTQAMLGEKFADAAAAFRDALNLNPADAQARQGLLDASSELRAADLTQAIKALTEELRNSKKQATKMADVNFKPNTAVVDVLKKGDTKVIVELTDSAPEDLSLKASAQDVNAKVLTGSGTIKKGEKSGAVTITTDNVQDTITEVTIAILATPNTKAASMTVKIKVKAN
jgi:tetratricopeptide (TPR) repeat protein